MKMLKILFLFICINIYSQNSTGGQSQALYTNLGTGIFKNAKLEATHPLGSPYVINKFADAKVGTIDQIAKMRYNVYKDEFEFISPKNDTLILDRVNDFIDVKFVNSNIKYKLVNYLNLDEKYQYGYLINMYEKNEIGLFKKEIILLSDEKIARTSLERDIAPQYSKSSDVYFLKNNGKIAEFPSNRKKLAKLYPDMKEVIEKFVKENKIDFDIDADKIKIIDLLATF